MRITYLVETVAQIWGGVKSALEAANLLACRGHQITVVSRSGPPDWMDLSCDFETVASFAPEHIPDSDIVLATFWNTVLPAVKSGKGMPVHYVQGYEGFAPLPNTSQADIDAAYRLEGVSKITISKHLQQVLRERFQCKARLVRYMVDHEVMYPDSSRVQLNDPVRVGLVGPFGVDWKDIRTGLQACALAHNAGLDLQLVRVTNVPPHQKEEKQPFPVEWHVGVPPNRMGGLYRSMDVFLGTSRGKEEGFFLPAVEAMACGVPAVLTEIPCHQGYGEGQYALFVPPQSPADMAEALVLVAKHPPVHNELAKNGLALAKTYTPTAHVNDLEEAFEEVLRPRTHVAVTSAIQKSDLVAISHSIAKALSEVSEVHLAAGRYADALEHIKAATRIHPESIELLQQLATAHQLAGDDDAALAIYDDLIRRNLGGAEVHTSRGAILFDHGDFPAAAASFEKALVFDDKNAETLNNLGVAYHRLARHDDARQCFEQALELDPDFIDASKNLQRIG
jgi:glycosyltransferase involved in cell wall biosynthesis